MDSSLNCRTRNFFSSSLFTAIMHHHPLFQNEFLFKFDLGSKCSQPTSQVNILEARSLTEKNILMGMQAGRQAGRKTADGSIVVGRYRWLAG